MKTVNLGDKVKDTVSGYEGIVIGKSDFLFGCTRIAVQAVGLHEEKPIESQWFDEPQVELVTPGVVATDSRPKAERTGGPMPSTPKRRGDAQR